jgi:hypothetical protein
MTAPWSIILKRWDAFISHASEDKDSVVLPLADALKIAGVRIWLDRFELRVGDSLREKIDEGLAESRFGIVILSSNFLAKGWPKRELNGLFALEESGRKVILPVWHGITKSILAAHSPILADRVAADTSRGIPSVAFELISAILDPNSGSPSVASPGLARRISVYLDGTHKLSEVTGFLRAHPDIIRTAVGSDADASLTWKSDLQASADEISLAPDAAIGTLWRTTGRRSWEFLTFAEPSTQILNDRGEVSESVASALQALAKWREWIRTNRRSAAAIFADITLDSPFTLVAGRRVGTVDKKEQLAELNESLLGVRIRTYDWLVEAAARLDERPAR